jgi:bifunctional non-homologous end joining protein LigD
MVFDLVKLAGRSLVGEPLVKRREALSQLLTETRPKQLAVSEAVVASGQEFFDQVMAQGHEGVMAKRLDSRYLAGKRTAAWQKIKPQLQIPCLIIGFRGEAAAPHSLLLAARDDGSLRYVGEIRAGLSESMRRELGPWLSSGRSAAPAVSCHGKAYWLRPQLYGLVHAFGWTASGLLCYPSLRRILSPRLPAT